MKKSANYALEMLINKAGEKKDGENSWALDVWGQIQEGFISPVEALNFALDQKVKGTVRVVRIASDLFGGNEVVPEPVYSLKKIVAEDKPKGKPGRKPRQPKKVKEPELTNPPPTTEVEDLEPEPPVTDEEDLPPVPDPIAFG